MYRVIEVAKLLGVSKVTIYKKINKNKKELKNHIHTRSNITYIDDEGVDIIKSTIEVSSSYSAADNFDMTDIKKASLEDLNQMINFLNQQVIVKKNQIERKNDMIDNLKSIIKSNRGKIQYLESRINE